MGKFSELIEKIYKKYSSIETMKGITHMLDNHFCELKDIYREHYNKVMKHLEDIVYTISREDAEDVVRNMRPNGERWTWEEVEAFIKEKGIDTHTPEYYLSMNMAYNGFKGLARYVGKEEDTDFYFELAKDFINDENNKPYKVAKYFLG